MVYAYFLTEYTLVRHESWNRFLSGRRMPPRVCTAAVVLPLLCVWGCGDHIHWGCAAYATTKITYEYIRDAPPTQRHNTTGQHTIIDILRSRSLRRTRSAYTPVSQPISARNCRRRNHLLVNPPEVICFLRFYVVFVSHFFDFSATFSVLYRKVVFQLLCF